MDDTKTKGALTDTQRKRVLDALNDILATEKFVAAPQMSAFLRYVVKQTVAGNQSRIKAFTVAVDALNKPETFDPQNDPVVRVLAGRLRAALSAYHDERPDLPVSIVMERGNYVPAFTFHSQKTLASRSQPPKSSAQAPQASTPVVADNAGDIARIQTDQTSRPDTEQQKDQQQPFSKTQLSDEHRSPNTGAQQGPARKKEQPAQAQQELVAQNTSSSHPKDPPRTSEYASEDRLSSDHQLSVPGTPPPYTKGLGYRLRNDLALLGIAVLIVMVLMLLSRSTQQQHLPVQTTLAAEPLVSAGLIERQRPQQPSVFIHDFNDGDVLNESLSTLASQMLIQHDDITVYRMLHSRTNQPLWPEDYLLTLNTVSIDNTRHINLQLIQAYTGRLVYAEQISIGAKTQTTLSAQAAERLSQRLEDIVAENGPLFSDYRLTDPGILSNGEGNK